MWLKLALTTKNEALAKAGRKNEHEDNQINHHGTPAQADEMLTLLDELRDQLCETHGQAIIEYRMNECSNSTSVTQQNLDFDDELF